MKEYKITYCNILNNIIDNNDNSEILAIVKELLCVVINDIENTNDLIIENDMLDLGNNKKISKDNFESLVSTIDTINEVLKEEKMKYYVLCRRYGVESILKSNGVEQYFDTIEQAQEMAKEMRKLVSSADYFVETLEEIK